MPTDPIAPGWLERGFKAAEKEERLRQIIKKLSDKPIVEVEAWAEKLSREVADADD